MYELHDNNVEHNFVIRTLKDGKFEDGPKSLSKDINYTFVNNGFFNLVLWPMFPLMVFGQLIYFYGMYLIYVNSLWGTLITSRSTTDVHKEPTNRNSMFSVNIRALWWSWPDGGHSSPMESQMLLCEVATSNIPRHWSHCGWTVLHLRLVARTSRSPQVLRHRRRSQ